MPAFELSITSWNKASTSSRPEGFKPAESGLATLLVIRPILSRGRSRRRASTIAGRTVPPSNSITSRPRTDWPSAAHSSAKAWSKPCRSMSLRSKRAQALSWWLVALTRRRKSVGKPRSSSKRRNESKGDELITPPKSQITA